MIITVILALPSVACAAGASHATGPAPTTARMASAARQSTGSKLLAFSRCVRRHGIPSFPDPQPGARNAKFPSAQQLGVSSTRLSAAENACAHLLPPGIGDQFPADEVQVLLAGMLRFSQCMRHQGISNWPDPATDSQGRPIFPLSSHGFTRQIARSQQITHAEHECQKLLPSALGGIPIG
jgi:hypothetical protein